jgi:ring-1,2-phenylacetyl-CoA epoxidase subunit PaaE
MKTDIEAHPDDTVLEAGQLAGLDLPFSCKGGVCATCRAKVVDGSVEMDVNYALEPWETDAGFVLTCQSRPTTDRLVIDYDAV